jgi:hypothetical protein
MRETNASCDPRRWRQSKAERDDLPSLFDVAEKADSGRLTGATTGHQREHHHSTVRKSRSLLPCPNRPTPPCEFRGRA